MYLAFKILVDFMYTGNGAAVSDIKDLDLLFEIHQMADKVGFL